jgi:phosphoribosylaminoimidazole-succinocarboxamide synthase
METNQALTSTNYYFRDQTQFYRGKVRDVYTIKNDLLVIVACDRISAFDHVLPRSIPYKGQVLTQVANLFLDQTQDIIQNWRLSNPDPQVTIGRKCDAIPVEFVVRRYLTGHAWRVYQAGGRELCGVKLLEGMKENQQFPDPIITPATKAESGHDEDISYTEILNQKILSKRRLDKLYETSLELYQKGTEYAQTKGLILVDTKYEFGLHQNEEMLIDEIHTPDSSRFFYTDSYKERFEKGEKQKQLSKEFVREWLIENGFQGLEGQSMPSMTDDKVEEISNRYQELFQAVTGKDFNPRSYENLIPKMEEAISMGINKYL